VYTRKSILKLGASAGLTAAAGFSVRGPAGAQGVLPPLPRAFAAVNGSRVLHVTPSGYAYLENAAEFWTRPPWTMSLLVRFVALPTAQPALFFVKGGSLALCVQGRRVGIIVLQELSPDIDPILASRLTMSTSDVLTPQNGSIDFPGYFRVSLTKAYRENDIQWDVTVGDTKALSVRGAEVSSRKDLYLGIHADGRDLLRGKAVVGADCQFLSMQVFYGAYPGQLPSLSLVSDDRLAAYDFSTDPPRRLLDKPAGAAPPPRLPFNCGFVGVANVDQRDGLDEKFAALVALKLAPEVRLHSRDAYRPSSVEWFLNRASLVRGHVRMRYNDVGRRFTLPSDLTLVQKGPLTAQQLATLAPGTQFGSAGETDELSLWPLEAAPGTTPVYDDGPWAVHPSPFSHYQVETLHGLPLQGGQCVAPCYCRISQRGEFYFLTYYFFYPYNGDLVSAVARQWDAPPLADNTGYEAHIGDWERVTAKIRIQPTANTVELIDVTMEAHGNETRFTGGPFSFPARVLAAVKPFPVYSSWHSHASRQSVGSSFPTDSPFADDVTDEGPLWRTANTLVFIDEATPWIRYNGLFGANITLTDNLTIVGANALKNGPEGPAYHDLWIQTATESGAVVR
jgi:hypothetical protein